ncbi:MAG: hypothetical protein RIC35_20430 [Marinoscillum sp.]
MKTIICYLDKDKGRDVEIVLPVTYALEKYFDCQIIFSFIWDIYLIRRVKPFGVLLPNTKGHHMYFEIAKYCYQSGIKVLALESEGNFRTDGSFYYWGYNHEHFFYQDHVTCWSRRTMDYVKSIANSKQIDKIVLTGGTGFDRYIICSFKDRQGFLEKYNKSKYEKIIGYAGWAFGKMYSAHKDIANSHIFPNDKNKRFQWIEKQRLLVKDGLENLIKSNPDKLFIFKRHPKESFESDIHEGPNEMNELLEYENVLYFKNEENIHDLINVSDLWLGFETTTCLEAWLMDKTTILYNPEEDFPRNNIHIGSPKAKTPEELVNWVDEFFTTGKLGLFQSEQLKKNRQFLIGDAIGFGDGLNHIRAVYYFSKSLNQETLEVRPKRNWRHLRLYYLMHLGKYFYNKWVFSKLPFFRKTIYVFETMYLKDLASRKMGYYQDLDKFYSRKKLDSLLKKDYWDDELTEQLSLI